MITRNRGGGRNNGFGFLGSGVAHGPVCNGLSGYVNSSMECIGAGHGYGHGYSEGSTNGNGRGKGCSYRPTLIKCPFVLPEQLILRAHA